MAGTNQIFTIVAFALLVVLVLGLGLLVAILVQRRRTKKAKVASELRKAERRRAAQAGVAGLHEDTETSGGISLLGLSVQQAVPDASTSAPSGPSPWAAAPRPAERPAAWLSASVQQASGRPEPEVRPQTPQSQGLQPRGQHHHADHPQGPHSQDPRPHAPRPPAPHSQDPRPPAQHPLAQQAQQPPAEPADQPGTQRMRAEEPRAPQHRVQDAAAFPAPQSFPEQAGQAPSAQPADSASPADPVPPAEPVPAPHAYGSTFSSGNASKR